MVTGNESFAVLIVEPGRARVCRFNVELRGEALWTTTTEELSRRLGNTRPEIIAVAGRLEVAIELADDLRRRGLAESIFLITPATDGEPTPTGQIRVILPNQLSALEPEDLVKRLVRAVLTAQAKTPVSPLTGLPGSPALRHHVEQLLTSGAPFVFLYLDIDNFKAFNDVYGFGRGDVAIRLLGREIIQALRELGDSENLCFHIGGDDFAVVTTADKAEAIAARIIQRFDAGVPELYDEAARASGSLETQNRRGEIERYPLMTVSVGGVDTARRRIGSYLELAEVAAEVKSYAKALEGSRFVLDRRRE